MTIIQLEARPSFEPMRAAIMLGLCLADSGRAGDWLTFGHDPQRSGSAPEETTLNPSSVARLDLKWKAELPNSNT